jgi:hypothetical protein
MLVGLTLGLDHTLANSLGLLAALLSRSRW